MCLDAVDSTLYVFHRRFYSWMMLNTGVAQRSCTSRKRESQRERDESGMSSAFQSLHFKLEARDQAGTRGRSICRIFSCIGSSHAGESCQRFFGTSRIPGQSVAWQSLLLAQLTLVVSFCLGVPHHSRWWVYGTNRVSWTRNIGRCWLSNIINHQTIYFGGWWFCT